LQKNEKCKRGRSLTQIFRCNWFHWYWQPKTWKQNTTYTRNTEDKQKKRALLNKTN